MKLVDWFYTTKLGEYYFEFLLWLDRRNDRPKYLSPKEVAQVTRQYSLLNEGVGAVKQHVNTMIRARNKQEYDSALKNIEDLTVLAHRKDDTARQQYADFLREVCVKKGEVDIATATDKAKMIEQRINDYKELQEHIVKRKAIREARKNNVKRN